MKKEILKIEIIKASDSLNEMSLYDIKGGHLPIEACTCNGSNLDCSCYGGSLSAEPIQLQAVMFN